MKKYYLLDMMKHDELNDQQREDWAENVWLNPMKGFLGNWRIRAFNDDLEKWAWIPSIIAGPEEHHLLWHNDDTGPAATPFRTILSADSREEALKEFEHFMYEMPLVLLSMHGGIPQDFTAYKGHVAVWVEWNGNHGLDAESFRQSYIADGKDEYRFDYLHAAEGQSIRIRPSTDEAYQEQRRGGFEPTWCPNCLHHGLGNTADGDHISCSECGYVEEVKE